MSDRNPMKFEPALCVQRFETGNMVSHNAGLIELHTKRIVTSVIGYDEDGGVRYRLSTVGGADRGLAYDCELDAWPGDDACPKTADRIGDAA